MNVSGRGLSNFEQEEQMKRWIAVISVATMLSWGVGCSNGDEGGGPPAMGGPPGGGSGDSEVSVETVTVERGEFVVTGDYAGEFRSEGMTELSSEVSGRVIALHAHIGDSVSEGDLIAQIDDRRIRQSVRELEANVEVSRASLEEALVNLENLRADLRRREPLVARQMVTEREVEELRSSVQAAEQRVSVARATIEQNQARLSSAREDLLNTEVRAPFDGKIGLRHVDRGTHVSTGQPLVSLVDDGDLYVTVQVPERNAARVNPDTPVTLRVGAIGSVPVAGKIHRIAPVLDSSTRSLRVDVTVTDPGDFYLRPGMYARVSMELGREEDALTLSNQAILRRTDGSPYLWKIVDGEATQTELTLGLAGRDRSQIVDGVEAGDRVVLRGHEKLEEGSKIRDLRAPAGADSGEES